MTIAESEIGFYLSSEVSSASTNGGRVSKNLIISNILNNVWPHVLKAEREAGGTLYRKLFLRNMNASNEVLASAQIWNDMPTPGGDYIVLFAGTQRDTQASITGSERQYGAGLLDEDVSSGNIVKVDIGNTAIQSIFQDGDQIRITDKALASDVSGNEQTLTINGAPTLSGTVLTITVLETIGFSFLALNTKVHSIYDFGDVVAGSDNYSVTSSAGTFDDTNYPALVDNVGTLEETITCQFVNATQYTVTSDIRGSLGSGNITTDFTSLNADMSNATAFVIEAGAFGGTFAQNDTVVFQTHPAAAPFWLKRVVPALTSSLSGNKNVTVGMGESA